MLGFAAWTKGSIADPTVVEDSTYFGIGLAMQSEENLRFGISHEDTDAGQLAIYF